MSYTSPDLLDPSSVASVGSADAGSGGLGGGNAAAMGLDILGGLLKGMAAYQSGEYNAKVADNNAALALFGAGDSRLRGQLAAENLLMRGSQLASKEKTAYAGAGVDVSSGSAVTAQADTKGMSAFDAMLAENNAAREAWGYESRGQQFKEQARIDRFNGEKGLEGSILGGITQAASVALMA